MTWANRKLLAWLLEQAQHEVHLARDGYEALGLMRKGVFDAVITDWDMPWDWIDRSAPDGVPSDSRVPWGGWDFRGQLGFEDLCRRGIRDLLQSIDPENWAAHWSS
jgi:CheY-like chemotaxis protein